MSNPENVVLQFCKAVVRADAKELGAFFTADAVYHNIPLAPVVGRAAIEETLKQFLTPGAAAEFEIKAIAVRDAKVLTERIDRFEMGGKKVELPVMGIFEVAPDGKISAWRDYFDMAQFTSQLG
jgi:limonene-1,2-epoxide hydrolase